MRRRALAGFAGFAMLLTATVGPVAAADHSVPGTPGDKNCVGQTTAYAAQFGTGGIKGYAAIFDNGNVQDLKAAIQAYCAS
jgi:hypothetical protein